MAELVVEVEEECIDCPNLSLETIEIIGHKIHRCEHLNFCKQVRGNWERIREKQVGEHFAEGYKKGVEE